MVKLNETQMLLLATAAKRDNGSVYPLPETRRGCARDKGHHRAGTGRAGGRARDDGQ